MCVVWYEIVMMYVCVCVCVCCTLTSSRSVSFFFFLVFLDCFHIRSNIYLLRLDYAFVSFCQRSETLSGLVVVVVVVAI